MQGEIASIAGRLAKPEGENAETQGPVWVSE